MSAYPEAGEAVVCKLPPERDPDDEAASKWSELTDDERQALNHERATKRAKGEARRFIVANRLRYMWVLTFVEGFHGAEGRREVMARVAAFIEDQLRPIYGSAPYWYSPELHPGTKGAKAPCPIPDDCGCGGHGWHVNLFVQRRIDHGVMHERWGRRPDHGFVWVKDWMADSRVQGLPFVAALRAGASYGAKYASKDWSAEMLEGGAHRYERSQGHSPKKITLPAEGLGDGIKLARGVFRGMHPVQVARSDEWEGWDGPPCWVLTFEVMGSWGDGRAGP